MKIIEARNVQEAFPKALDLLAAEGVKRQSRNGPVFVAPWPVATIYSNPWERVLFWPQRDANPFFHLYEALWMLQGRNDLEPLVRYAKQMGEYSDDGKFLNGAYGQRWRRHFGYDQLAIIAKRLQTNPDDRRSVLSIWDGTLGFDLNSASKDVPCNTTVTFQINHVGKLEMTVFNRSNDILWGAYGANAVHFAFLHEYMAAWIGAPLGVYRQISVNWHGYEATLGQVIPRDQKDIGNPYAEGRAQWLALAKGHGDTAIAELDRAIDYVLTEADTGFMRMFKSTRNPFLDTAYIVLYAHHQWKTLTEPERFDQALSSLDRANPTIDWVIAAKEWIARRRVKWETKLAASAQV